MYSYCSTKNTDTNYRFDEKKVDQIEKVCATYVEQKTTQLFEKTQKEYKSDIFGFGEKVRVQNNAYFKEIEWDEVFPEAVITSEVNLKIRHIGVRR